MAYKKKIKKRQKSHLTRMKQRSFKKGVRRVSWKLNCKEKRKNTQAWRQMMMQGKISLIQNCRRFRKHKMKTKTSPMKIRNQALKRVEISWQMVRVRLPSSATLKVMLLTQLFRKTVSLAIDRVMRLRALVTINFIHLRALEAASPMAKYRNKCKWFKWRVRRKQAGIAWP